MPLSETRTNSRSIRTDLLLWLSASLLVVGFVMVLANKHNLTRPIEAHINVLASHVSNELVEKLSDDVWNMDNQAIRGHFIDYPWGSLGLVSIKVTTEFGDVLFEKIYTTESNPISKKTAVLRNGNIIGYVEVSLSTRQLLTTQQAIERSGIMIITIAILVILMVCTLAVNAVVIRPVKQTVSGVRTIAGGDYKHQLPYESAKELNSINKEINAMASVISKRQRQLKLEISTRKTAENELKRLNSDLEERIKQRTEQLRRLAQMLASAQDNEQKRIAEGLHDDVAQLLAASLMKITVATAHVPSKECEATIKDINDLVKQAYDRLRLLSFELASSTLYQWGLKDSLTKLCSGMNERYDVDFELIGADNAGALDDSSATVIFKAARELLFNVVKHSGVKAATVRLERNNGQLTLMVEDKGKGFEGDINIEAGSGLGLFSIKERLQHIGGELLIASKPGEHTCVSLIVPWVEKDTAE